MDSEFFDKVEIVAPSLDTVLVDSYKIKAGTALTTFGSKNVPIVVLSFTGILNNTGDLTEVSSENVMKLSDAIRFSNSLSNALHHLVDTEQGNND